MFYDLYKLNFLFLLYVSLICFFLKGCNHMTCVCRYEFCYVCRKKWKTCICLVWDEARLLEETRARAGDQAPAAVLEQVRHAIFDEDNCLVHDWVSRNGRAHVADDCSHCGYFMPVYHYECRECGMNVCSTCRFQRIG